MSAIAVVGLSCRLPGNIRSPHQFWDALMAGRDLVTDPTEDHPRASILPAAILTEDESGFDADHFGLSTTEVRAMDPQQQMLLELVDEAFQDAGLSLASHRGTRVGLWVGTSCLDQALLRLGPGQGGTMVDTAGAIPSMIANRTSRHPKVDWTGPSEVIDTACSASLVAVHRARQALECGEVDLAVVAGTNVLALDTHTRMFAASGVLADHGRVRPFDKAGTGFVRGEGGGAIVLQRAVDTSITGTRTRALLVGSRTNSDGARHPIGTPNPEGQIDLLTGVYARAGIDTRQVDYIEAHGTGTPVGDSAEGRAAGRVLAKDRDGEHPLWMGSVKANLGHLEGAAGIIGLIKVVLSLEHGMIPPTIHHSTPLAALGRMGVRVPTTARPWPTREEEHVPTAGVSAFGFGGTNAHVIVQAAPPQDRHDRPEIEGHAHLVPVSAGSLEALATTASSWADHLAEQGHPLGAVAATATHRRDHHTGARAAMVATSVPDLVRGLGAVRRGSTGLWVAGPRQGTGRPTVVFVYPGHGAHPEEPMAPYGLGAEPVFVKTLEQAMAQVRSFHSDRSRTAPGGLAQVQPVQWAWQVAATALLRSWGVVPDAVVGHSLGEIAAAHTAGALDLGQAAQVVAERSLLLEETAKSGALVATALSADQAQELARSWPGVAVAAINAPRSTVLSGPLALVQDLAQELQARGVWVRMIDDAPPAHSPSVAHQAERLPDLLGKMSAHPTRVPLVSTVTGRHVQGTEMDGAYWGRQLRATVRLQQAIEALIEPGRPVVLVEIGARSVLASALASTLAGADRRYEVAPPLVSTAGPGQPRQNLLMALAELYTHGIDPHWPTPRTPDPVPLPLRAWDHGPALAPEVGVVSLLGLDSGQALEVIEEQVTVAVRDLVAEPLGEVSSSTQLTDVGLGSLARAHLHTLLLTRMPDLSGLDRHVALQAATAGDLTQQAYHHLLTGCRTRPTPEGLVRPG